MSSKWQPIETAPKDGSTILIFAPDASKVDPTMIGVSTVSWQTDSLGGFWCAGKNIKTGRRQELAVEPSHWMPIPELPR